MGQYGNQPDFATEADDNVQIVTKLQAAQRTGYLGGACLYIGTGGDINVLIAGTQGGGQPYRPVFKHNKKNKQKWDNTGINQILEQKQQL